MRYLYQQLLAFCSMIAMIILIVGVSFTQLTKQTIEENNYQQLFGYAESVEKTTQTYAANFPQLSQDQAFQNALLLTEQVLTEQNVNFIFIDKNERLIYPTDDSMLDFTISPEQWKNLRNGKQQKFTDHKNILGQQQATSYALVPFNLNHEFYGALVVSQPARNIDNSVRSVTLNLFKGFIFSSIVAVIASYVFAAFQVKRINRLRNATKEVTNGNFDVQLPVHDKDEFDELADDFNKMTNSLKESQAEIEEQENRRRQFMADAAHEMRTPLTTINGLLEGLAYDAIPENQRENAIKLMKNETERLIRLVNENLDYEKIRTDQITMVIKKFNGTETLRNLVTQLEAKAEAAGDTLILEAQEEIDVYADYDRFVQIMVNIIQNAIQFTENGQITISIEKGYLETIIKIKDTGIGISEQQMKNIWERYYKVDPSRKNTKYGESGLGLPIVQQLVRLHKGKIEVESEEGKGTTFTVRLPDVEIKEVSQEN
ncbi:MULTISPECIES: sensor histidine kinase [Enterococcus]|uniref:histidine kinase n=1 Tax=Enterococcus thailandicus TaxID=417368 RepID=A0A179EQJ4_ENTTH|nr:HAMP domain-containing sensor histidine kinase [Enterococcus thailandicus]MDA3964547.1 HAMP domain-containing sensor histidine kinase [Enterococcus thailandicus]MDK4352391.1 HAMP domain-containing histidine kinase [Enterococcus thailandicus]MDT2735200.1 HAMP domain-containing sensor histidine kinase [Enterococcus thailandicus]MDT2751226.1 HAMP domain-containing sensor histidine kinase [Enterococcus thailandicus]MDT2775447.1 HAMP domain-containing sensor histidine kinase [Enterococcus thaila